MPILLEASLTFGELEAYADVLTKVEQNSSEISHNYVPSIVVGIQKVKKRTKT